MEFLKMNEIHLKVLTKTLKEFDEFWNEKVLIDEFYNENSEYFVLVFESEVIGFGGLWFNIDEAHIMNIAIKKDYRKKGFGNKLLEFLIKKAQSYKKECITLEVKEDNIPALCLYKKQGFEELGRRKKYYEGKYDGIIMTRYFNKN